MRERFFTPRVRVKSYEELNALLLDGVIAYAKAHPHPEEREHTVWERFEAERAALVPYAGRFDGFHAITASVSTTCLVRFDNNRYSVMASAIGRPVEVWAYAAPDEDRLHRGLHVVVDAALAGAAEAHHPDMPFAASITAKMLGWAESSHPSPSQRQTSAAEHTPAADLFAVAMRPHQLPTQSVGQNLSGR